MSFQDLKISLEKAKMISHYRIKGETSHKVIVNAESLLGFKLSKQNKEFYASVGYLSFYGNEFYGICKDDFSGTSAICAIETTLKEREKYNLPQRWLIFCSFDDGLFGYLDYSSVNKNGEPPILMVMNENGIYKVVKKVSNDIGDFILKIIESSI